MDIINSDTINIRQNLLLTPTCHGIYTLNSSNLVIDSNKVFGGITYAINVLSYPEIKAEDDYVKKISALAPRQNVATTNVVISNNFMSQNRYGIAVSDTSNLNVNNNVFIQRFSDAVARKFWTNNSILLQNVTGLTWTNNIYKEAFTQEINGDNSQSLTIVPFPQTGGVTL
jgi:parallel beta-helix repeat protein